jgi:hypothetical protein
VVQLERTRGQLPSSSDIDDPYPPPEWSLRCVAMELRRPLNGAMAGAAAAALWAAQQPLDKRVFGSGYDDVELLGKLVARGPASVPAGLAMHMANGAAFGAVYALVRPLVPAPPLLTGVIAGLAEHLAFWPLGRFVDRLHPARDDLEPLSGNRRAFAQATWRHLLFGATLAGLERRLNDIAEFEPLEEVPASNGHGNLEHAAVGAES